MEHINERCCPKPKRYKPDFYVKELKKVWPADEEMKNELRLYDEAHSREKCINMEYYAHLEKELYTYAYGKKEPSCQDARVLLLDCLNANCMSNCTDKINHFIHCVNETIRTEYAPKTEI